MLPMMDFFIFCLSIGFPCYGALQALARKDENSICRWLFYLCVVTLLQTIIFPLLEPALIWAFSFLPFSIYREVKFGFFVALLSPRCAWIDKLQAKFTQAVSEAKNKSVITALPEAILGPALYRKASAMVVECGEPIINHISSLIDSNTASKAPAAAIVHPPKMNNTGGSSNIASFTDKLGDVTPDGVNSRAASSPGQRHNPAEDDASKPPKTGTSTPAVVMSGQPQSRE